MHACIPTQDSDIYDNIYARTNSDSNILATVEIADRVDFLEEDYSSTSLYGAGFMEIKIYSHVPYNVKSLFLERSGN